MTQLRGITWDHPRGVEPVRAAAAAWAGDPALPAITWEARSLADFEDASVLRLAEEYDVIAVDHPHIGLAVERGALAPVPHGLDPIADGSGDAYVGLSLESYRWDGQLWALPADAATMVSASTDPSGAPQTWNEVLEAVRTLPWGTVVLPANPTHLLLTVLSVTEAVAPPGPRLTDGRPSWWANTLDVGRVEEAVTLVQELIAAMPPWCSEADPIRVLDALADSGGPRHVPLVFGYSPYARSRAGQRRVHFASAPRGNDGRVGTVLGGVGFAASSRRGSPEAALEIVRRLSAKSVQCGLVPDAGGQPAHRAAWTDPGIDDEYGGFYSGTADTMERSFLRPRVPAYPAFQRAAADALHRAITSGLSPRRSAELLRDTWESHAL